MSGETSQPDNNVVPEGGVPPHTPPNTVVPEGGGPPHPPPNTAVPECGVPPQVPSQSAVSESGGPSQSQPAATKGNSMVVITGKPKRGRPPKAKKSAEHNASQSSNTNENLGKLIHAHKNVMDTCGPCLPTNMVEANTMIQSLLSVAQQVTSGNGYDWMKVAAQLGFNNVESYMTFMHKVDEVKRMCAEDKVVAGEGEGGGTQESDATTAKKGPLIQHQKSHK
ncbi:smoothelin-like protein 1 isoform X1 [Sesbania bispinosa]|nr:smoothelin-like protein 1 isoform X1 [Sesbania bispinosa]